MSLSPPPDRAPAALPFVSVVIPTRNRAHLLVTCLESLSQQRYPADRFEIIVVDDGSLDATPEIVDRVAARPLPAVRYLPQAQGGVNVARNAGIAAARGDPICFLDDDEDAPPGWLSALVDATGRHPAAGCLGGPLSPPFQ